MEFDFSHLICFSPTHSSHIIGEVIMRGLFTENSEETDLTYDKPVAPLIIRKAITVVIAPVYGGRIAETALERMKDIRGEDSLAVPVVVYGNRDYDDALIELRDWCTAHGFVVIGGAAFIGEHSYSRPDRPVAAHRPDEHDLQVALKFGQEIKRYVHTMADIKKVEKLKVKGNFPYKEKGTKTLQTPLTNTALCSQCGFCIEICPVQAIRLEEEIISDAEICIKCCACVKQCPAQARIFDTPYTDLLFKNFTARREPELFYLEI